MKFFSELRKETFAEYVNGSGFKITNPGPLHAPTVRVSIRRNKDLDLVLESVLADGAVSAHPAPRPGEVFMVGGTVEFKSSAGMMATATGIVPRGTRPQWNEDVGVFATTERATLNTFEIVLPWATRQAYIVEWFFLRPNQVIWPEITTTRTVINHNLQIGGAAGLDIKMQAAPEDGFSMDMVTLNIEGHRIYLREEHSRKSSKRRGHCMLIYCDATTPEFRTKVQECISLALGIHLVYLGYTGFSENWDVASMRAVRGYSINNRVFELAPQPPSPLSARSYSIIDGTTFNRHVNALYAHYDRLHLGHLSWSYWHAMCAPAHIGAAHYGALIEALRAAYVKSNPELHGGRIIADPDKWGKASGVLNTALDGIDLDQEARRMLSNKISNLNSLPADRLMELVCERIGIRLGEAERAAWRRRNLAAHGNRISPDEYVQVVRDIKLLNIVFNRMLLAMTGASQHYIDYYSADHPTRRIAEPVPG